METKKVRALLLLVLLSVLTGCWSRKEIEDLGIVTTIGFDKITVNGREKWLVSNQVLKLGQNNSKDQEQGSGGTGLPVWLVSGTGDNVLEAGRNTATRSSREMYLSHVNLLVLGERVAKEELDDVIDFFMRDRRLRLRAWVLVAKGQALDVLRAEPELENQLADELRGLININQPKASKAYVIPMKDFINQLAEPGRDAVASKIELFSPMEKQSGAENGANPASAMETQGKKAVRLTGAAVFRKNRLVGWLGDNETKGYLYATNKAKYGIIVLKYPGHHKIDVSFSMTRSKSVIKPEIKDGRITYSINIQAEGDLGEHQDVRPITQPEKIKLLEKTAAEEIRRMVEGTVRTAQEEYNADIFGLGRTLHKKYPEIWKDVKNDWEDIYPTLEVLVNAEVKIRRTGMIDDTPLIK